MMIGNNIVQVNRADILKTENEKKSLMYENLLHGISEEEKASLLDFIVSLSE